MGTAVAGIRLPRPGMEATTATAHTTGDRSEDSAVRSLEQEPPQRKARRGDRHDGRRGPRRVGLWKLVEVIVDASTTTTPSKSTTIIKITPASFTADFSAMAQLKSLAAKGKGLVGVLLPDTTTSARYESYDRPYLTQAFKAAGLSSSQFKVDNAQGSPTTMQTQADADITAGASVLLIDAIDSGSGAAIEASAKAKGVAVIDYDRLTLGGDPNRILRQLRQRPRRQDDRPGRSFLHHGTGRCPSRTS